LICRGTTRFVHNTFFGFVFFFSHCRANAVCSSDIQPFKSKAVLHVWRLDKDTIVATREDATVLVWTSVSSNPTLAQAIDVGAPIISSFVR
jgi:hypothetical protein